MFRYLAYGILTAVIAGMAVPAGAQQSFALVDLDQLMINSDRGKEIAQKLQKEFSAQVDELRNQEAALTALRTRIASQSTTLSGEALEKLKREFQDAQVELQRFTQDVERAVQTRQTELLNVLQKDVLDLLEEFRNDKGLSAIFSKQSIGLLAAEPSLDVTDQVMQRLNTTP